MDDSNPIHPREYPQLIDLDRLRTIYSIMEIFQKKHDKTYSIKILPRIYLHLQEMSILTPEQLTSYSLKCEEPTAHPVADPIVSHAQDTEVIKPYKTPPALNHWSTEVQRIWTKPFEQLPIGIDLPRLATSIFVGNRPDPACRHYIIPQSEPSMPGPVSSSAQGVDTRAREIMAVLVELAKLLDGEDYSNTIRRHFSDYVILEGVKDRDMSREIASLFEYLGKECKIARVLKAINQAIIAPPIIELTLNVCSKLPFRDAGGWRIYVHRHDISNQLVVTHVKKQKARSHAKEDEFEFEWRLEIVFGDTLDTISHVSLKITDIGYGEMLNPSKKVEVEGMLRPYAW